MKINKTMCIILVGLLILGFQFDFAHAGVNDPQIVTVGLPGSSASKWYIRPRGGVYGKEDGTSYANAFDGNADAWANPQDIDAGDTVYVCGKHLEMITVKDSGVSGAPIVLDGACPEEPGTINSAAVTSPIHQDGIQVDTQNYVIVQNFGLVGGRRNGIMVYNKVPGTTPVTGIIIRNNTVDNRYAKDATNVCHGIYFSGAGSFTHSSIRDNKVIGTSRSCAGQDNNDDINFEDGTYRNLISGNEAYGGHEGIDVSGSGMTIQNNYLHNNYYSGIKTHGLNGCPRDTIVTNNIIVDNRYIGAIFQDSKNSYFVNNVIIHSGYYTGLQIQRVNQCEDTGNVYADNFISASYTAGAVRIYSKTKAEFEAEDIWKGNIINQNILGAPLIYFSMDTSNNIMSDNWANRWLGTIHPKEQKNQQGVFVGVGVGTAKYQLAPGSPAQGAGVCYFPYAPYYCALPDFLGRLRPNPPSIGAF